jgi:hypothetical protein
MEGEWGGLSEESSDEEGGKIVIKNRHVWADAIPGMA